jgi:hypothetical protein
MRSVVVIVRRVGGGGGGFIMQLSSARRNALNAGVSGLGAWARQRAKAWKSCPENGIMMVSSSRRDWATLRSI